MHLILQRHFQVHKATIGVLHGLRKPVYTLEDEWLNNRRNLSCIPAGTYRVRPHGWEPDSQVKFKRTYMLLDVENRTAILIHAGNSINDTQGCILVGEGLALHDVAQITHSRNALELLRQHVGNNSFTLTIKDWSHGYTSTN